MPNPHGTQTSGMKNTLLRGAIKLAYDPVFHSRTKHIDIQIHFGRQYVEDNHHKLRYCATEEMVLVADVMMKAFPMTANNVSWRCPNWTHL